MHPKVCCGVILCLLFQQVLSEVPVTKNPYLQKYIADANLLYEILLSGVELDRDNNIVLLDQELASMRSGRAFLSQINDGIPRGLGSMGQMVMELESQRKKPLAWDQFNTLVLSTVYSAHRAGRRGGAVEDRENWAVLLLQLANVTVHDLRGTHLFNYT